MASPVARTQVGRQSLALVTRGSPTAANVEHQPRPRRHAHDCNTCPRASLRYSPLLGRFSYSTATNWNSFVQPVTGQTNQSDVTQSEYIYIIIYLSPRIRNYSSFEDPLTLNIILTAIKTILSHFHEGEKKFPSSSPTNLLLVAPQSCLFI